MLDNNTLNDLASKLSAAIPESVQTIRSDVEKNLRAILESGLEQMNLVSREEFDVQAALLERTLEKLDQLEQQLKELEKNL